MRIIKEGKQNATEWLIECERCGCVFLFDDRDVSIDQREYDEWVNCPTCKRAIHCEDRKYWGKDNIHGIQ